MLAPDSGYVITRDGAVLAVRTLGPDGTVFGQDWQPGNWVLVFPRDRDQAPHALPHASLADAIRAGREPGRLGWAVQVGDRPGLVPPPSRDVHYPVQTPQRAIDNWRDDVRTAHRLAAATRELLPYTGDNQADLEARLDRADRGVRSVPVPPMALPASPQDRAAAWQDLGRFQHAADELGRAVAEVLTSAFADWRQVIDPFIELAEQVREVQPRNGRQEPDLVREQAQLDTDIRAIPRPPAAFPATVAQVSEVTPAIERIHAMDRQGAFSIDALTNVLAAATQRWDDRVADAMAMAAAAEKLLPYTGEHQDDLRETLVAKRDALTFLSELQSGLLDDTEDTSVTANFEKLRGAAGLEDATNAVLTTVTALAGLQSRVAAGPDLFDTASAMLPYTLGTPGLTDKLHTAAGRLREVSRVPDLTTPQQIEAALQWMAGEEPSRLRRAVRDFERIVTQVATAATEEAERLERLVRQANALLPHTGGQRRALGLELFKAGGTPAGAQFTAPRWPRLRPRTAAAAAAAAAQIETAALRHRRLDDAVSSEFEAAITKWQTRLAQIQNAAAEYAALQPQRLEDAVRSVFEAAITEWQTRLQTATRLLGRLNSLPESVTQRHLLQWDLGEAYRKLSLHAAELSSAGDGLAATQRIGNRRGSEVARNLAICPSARRRMPSGARSPYWSMSQCGWWRPQSA